MHTELPASVPGPVPPGDRRAWYAPAVRSQYAVARGIVATVTEEAAEYRYRVREPPLSETEAVILDRVESRFEDVPLSRPRTRAGAVERVEAGLTDRLRDRIHEFEKRSPESRRRLAYHLLASLRSLGPLTPFALDDRVRIADTEGNRLAVHTRDFAPASTDLPGDTPHLDRFLGERVIRKEVDVLGFAIPVTIVRGHLLGSDAFDLSYVVEEPILLPGDRALIETVTQRILEAPPDGVLTGESEPVIERVRRLLRRRIGYRSLYRLTDVLSDLGAGRTRTRPDRDSTEMTSRAERIDDLAYYVARDLIGDGTLTVPLRDADLRAVEADGSGGRINVVFHREGPVPDTRMPTTLEFEGATEFVDIARSLAAEGGIELSVDRPSATVSLDREGAERRRSMHCSIALPGTDGRGHISIASERQTPPTPIAFVDREQMTAELVAGIWTAAAAGGSIVFVGPVDAEPEAVLGAHAPFIPATERPVAIGPGASQIDLPHETALSVFRETGSEGDTRWATRIERDALHPDVAVVSELNSADGLKRLGAVLASGRQVFAAGRIASRPLFDTLLETAGVGHQIRAGVDLVVELTPPGTRGVATGWVPVTPDRNRSAEQSTDVDNIDGRVQWRRLFDSDSTGESPSLSPPFLDRLRDTQSNAGVQIEDVFFRRNRYVEFLESEGVTDREGLLSFLTDLQTDEAATIERIRDRTDR